MMPAKIEKPEVHHIEEGLGPLDQDAMEKKSEVHPSLSQPTTVDRGELEFVPEDRFHRLGWKRLSAILVVEAVALGTLSIPSSFAALGMVLGIITCAALGIVAMYAAFVIGEVKLKFPGARHYGDIGRVLMGKFGFHLLSSCLVIQLALVVGSHCLTGETAFKIVTESSVCSLVFTAATTLILTLFAIPPSFAEMSILGYIDFVSLAVAVMVTIVCTGIQATHSTGGLAGVPWSAWPKEGVTFPEVVTAITNMVFAYSFAIVLPSFMDELHTPTDFSKAVVAVSVFEIGIYTFVGAILYAFIGQDVQAPAFLSAGKLVSKIAFGIAFPLIFISGSINVTVIGRFIFTQAFNQPSLRGVNTRKGWAVWLSVIIAITLFAAVIAEVIPIVSSLLGLISSLFGSAFSIYIPPILWFRLIKEGAWYDRRNIKTAILNGVVFVIGIAVFGCGTYSSVVSIIQAFEDGQVSRPFAC